MRVRPQAELLGRTGHPRQGTGRRWRQPPGDRKEDPVGPTTIRRILSDGIAA
jgi:hypothetical protein